MADIGKIYKFRPDVRQLLESSKFAFSVLQVTGGGYRAILVSEGLCRMFGLGHEELAQYLTNKSYRRTHPDDAGKLMEASRDMQVKDEVSIVIRMHLGDAYRPVLFHSTRMAMEDGTTLYFVSYYDITSISESSHNWVVDYLERQKDGNYTDSVTGLPNNIFLKTFAQGTLREYLDHGENPYLILFDIQGMHFYNDRFGYEAGDKLLRETGSIIQAVFEGDFCVHNLEDHFVVITVREDIKDSMEQVRARLHAYAGGAAVDINAGVYEYKDGRESVEAAVDKARRALDYIHGKPEENLCWYSSEVSRSFSRTNWVLSHYRDAIKEGWIKVYYQPLVGSLSGKVSHVEALSRWDDPRYGMLNPGEFIGILEEKHRLWELDLYVLEVVCREIRDRKEAGKPYAFASVNLSRHDLGCADIHERINGVLDKYGIPHKEIAIEITESAIVDHEELIAGHVRRFHEDGYEVWLDDFGSGYSSFNALQNFDFDLLKIDMLFLRHQNRRTPNILTSIVDLTKKLGIRSVTEGVETEEQANMLKQMGCGLLQGFLYSKPVPDNVFFENMDQLGLEIETPEDREFYRQMQRVNVISTEQPVPDINYRPLGGAKGISLIVERDGFHKIIYTNEVGAEWLRNQKMPTLDDVNRILNQSGMPIHLAMKECFAEVHKVGDIAERVVHDPEFEGEMQVELVACDKTRRGFVVSTIYKERDEA